MTHDGLDHTLQLKRVRGGRGGCGVAWAMGGQARGDLGGVRQGVWGRKHAGSLATFA